MTSEQGAASPTLASVSPLAGRALALAFVLGVGAVASGCAPADRGQMSADREAALADTIRSLAEEIDAAWKKLEPDAYLQHYSDDVQFYYQGSRFGRSAFEKVVRQEMPAIEEWSTEITDTRVEASGSSGELGSRRSRWNGITL